MIEKVTDYRFQKCGDVELEYACYELVSGDAIILSFSISNNGQMEVLLESDASGCMFPMEDFQKIISEGIALLEKELADG